MRKLLAASTAALAMFFSLAVFSPAADAAGGDNVFPLDFPLPFPWDKIEGVWQVEGEGLNALFSFEVQNDCSNRRILKVLQLDAATGEVVAEGIGTQHSRSQQVYAGMKGPEGTYMLYVGAYRTKGIFPENVTGLRIWSFTQPSTERRFRIHKIDSEPIQNSSAVSGSDCK